MKKAWIDAEHAAGVREIEVASLVPPKLIPQFADSEDVVRHALSRSGLTVAVLIPNLKGAERAIAYRLGERWTGTLAGRYSGPQYRTLNNADVNGFTYMGVSKFATVDLRVVYRIAPQWRAAFGIDNLNDYRYWNFHPYPQRSWHAELRFDL